VGATPGFIGVELPPPQLDTASASAAAITNFKARLNRTSSGFWFSVIFIFG
jgi:hypothetical protein